MWILCRKSDWHYTACSECVPLPAHLCLRLRVRFLLREQIEVGCHDDVRSLVRSVRKYDKDNHQGAKCHWEAAQS